jgi:hypothetical protein
MRFLARLVAVALPLALLTASPLLAQAKGGQKKPAKAAAAKAETPAPPTPTKVELVQVNDRRSSGSFAMLNVHVILPDVLEKDVAAQRVIPKVAVDDTGKDLVAGAMRDNGLQPTAAGMGMGGKAEKGEAPSPARMSISLDSPARSATFLKEVSGEIELYMPGRDPSSTVRVEKITAKIGKALSHPALTASGVEIDLLSKAQLDAEKKKLGEKKKLEMKKEGFSAETMADVLKSFLENLVTPEEGELVARVKDPEKRIQGYAYVTPSGEQKRVVGMDRDGFTVFSTWGVKPQPDWALKIDLKSPKALVRYIFSLANLALP